MRLLVSLLFVCPLAAQFGGFSIAGQEEGSWPQILSSVGLQRVSASDATVFVARAGVAASAGWNQRAEAGGLLILEGDSPLAQSFGFRASGKTTRLATLLDVHQPKLPLILEKPLEIELVTIPPQARLFSRERWTNAPVVAGFKRGKGAVLWVAVHPGPQGYERLPYLPQAMSDLGFEAPFRSNRTWAFFDYSYRTRVDLDYFAAKWRAAGISALHVASWHFYEPDEVRDAYLKHLIEACHREGILVYAWLEIPHVSEKFWTDHPEWREKTALLQDAQLDWRKLMNLANPDCAKAVRTGVREMVGRFDWDGVNLAELYYESLEGAANPARFTPMNLNVRAAFQQAAGFDPIELWSTRKDAASLRQFLDFRAGLARRMQEDWLREAETYRVAKPDLDIVLTHVDDRFDTGMRDAIGADTSEVLPLLKEHDFTFLIEDPATVWNLGPKRYPEIAKRYPQSSQLAIDINVVSRYQDVYPTKQQTGTELFQLLHLAAGAFPRVALYFENSLLVPDLPLLASAGAVATRVSGSTVESPYGIGVHWAGAAMVDGRAWPVGDGQTVWLPAGVHEVKPSAHPFESTVLTFNGLLRAAELTSSGVQLVYESESRALAVLDKTPASLKVDGVDFPIRLEGKALFLPRGHHTVFIQ